MINFTYDPNKAPTITDPKGAIMQAQYDFSTMASRPNPYAKALKAKLQQDEKQSITIPLSIDVIDYFKDMASQTNVPYQTLIDMYLKDCVKNHRQLTWA